MIWEHALGGQMIKLGDRAEPTLVTDRFVLLRVCRQIYSEAAMLPHTTNTFCIKSAERYSDYAKAGLIKHVRHVKVFDEAACYMKTGLLSRRQRGLQKINVTIWRPRFGILSPTPWEAVKYQSHNRSLPGHIPHNKFC
jgi:hypothetical protein